MSNHSNDYSHLPVWPQADTPCIGFCSTSLGDSVCLGCGRTMAEIDGWLFKTNEEKQECWQRIQAAGVGYRWSTQKN